MRLHPSLRAQISLFNVTSKRSFEKLDRTPPTVFHYFYQLQVKELHKVSSGNEILEFANRNSAFKRHMRREWDSLSISKKRVYHALYFHFTDIKYEKMSYEELAKRLEIPIPVATEYLLFRNSFKTKFDTLWEEGRKRTKGSERNALQLKTGAFGKFKVTRIIKRDTSHEDYSDFSRRFQEMCRECRSMWREKVTEEQKIEMGNKLRDARNNFIINMEKEVLALNALQASLTDLLRSDDMNHVGPLKVERPQTNSIGEPLELLFLHSKKKLR